MKTYLFSYGYRGVQCSLRVPAENVQEAKERVKVMLFATYDGTLIATIPVFTGDWLPSLICAIRSWCRKIIDEYYELVKR